MGMGKRKEYQPTMKTPTIIKRFIQNKRGIVAVLAVGVALIILTAMIWVVSMFAVGNVWDALAPMIPARFHGTMTMLNNVCGWALLIEIVGLAVWMGVHAFKKEVVDIPA